MEPVFVTAPPAIGDRFGQPIGLGPDELGAQEQSEFVDAAQRIAPRQADEGLRPHPVQVWVSAVGYQRRAASTGQRPALPAAVVVAAVLVAEVDEERAGVLEDADHLAGARDQGVEIVRRGGFGADLAGIVFPVVLIVP